MAIAWIAFRENVDQRLLIGAFAILAGAALLSWQGQAIIDRGALLIAAACICWGIDNNLTRKLSAADPVQIAIAKGLVAGVVNLSLALKTGATLPPWSLLLLAGVAGFGGYGISLVLYVVGLRHLGAARMGAYFSLAPFIGAVLSLALLHEPLTLTLLLAGGLMAVGLWLHLAERHEHDHIHDTLEHDHRHIHDAHHQHEHGPNDPAGDPHAHWHSGGRWFSAMKKQVNRRNGVSAGMLAPRLFTARCRHSSFFNPRVERSG
jgi:uncharacterized membrane protein